MGNKLEEYVLVYQSRNELVRDELFVQKVPPHHLPECYGLSFVADPDNFQRTSSSANVRGRPELKINLASGPFTAGCIPSVVLC